MKFNGGKIIYQRGMSTIVTILLVVLVAGGLGVGGYFGYNWWQDQAQKDTGATTPTPPPAPPDPTAGWQVYTDSANGFSVKYPPDWTSKEGTFPSTHGETLKDVGFFAPSPKTDKVFVTVRTNPDASLEAFVQADGGTTIQPAKVDTLDGFAAVTADSYRVYLGKEAKVYMFTFPGAKTNSDLTVEQVNLLTSFKFTSAGSSTPSPTTSPSSSTPPTLSALDALKAYYQYSGPINFYSTRARECYNAIPDNQKDPESWATCGIEDSNSFQDPAPLGEITFTVKSETSTKTVIDSSKAGQSLYEYTFIVENGKWKIDKVAELPAS